MQSLEVNKVYRVTAYKASEPERKEEGRERGGGRGGMAVWGCVWLRMQTVSAVYTLLRLTGSAAAPQRLVGKSCCVIVFSTQVRGRYALLSARAVC